MRRLTAFIFTFLVCLQATAQNGYKYTGHVVLPEQYQTLDPFEWYFPMNCEDVKAIGMGNTQIANGNRFNAMMYNPALLGKKKTTFEVFTLQANMPPGTLDAASFLANHISEFEEAISLTRVYDGVNAFFEPEASTTDRLNALTQIQDGMQFTIDLFETVTGPVEEPQKHGISILPGFSMQLGNWGFSLYGFGQGSFLVQQSPTLDAILEIDIPTDLSQPIEAVKSMFQLLGIMKTVFLENSMTPRDEVFPIAYYVSYIDIVGSVGYGRPISDRFYAGANLKIINRRFSLDRIPVVDYDAILDRAFDNLKSDATGITFDLGAYYQCPWKTEAGMSLQNIIPVKELSSSIETEFSYPQVIRRKTPDGQFIVDSDGDTAMVSTIRNITRNRPFVLKVPFLVNLGINHPISENWNVSLDLVDIAGQDTRYESYWDRLRMGTEYRYEPFKDKWMLIPRVGLMDSRMTAGFGMKIMNVVHLDGAYAYDRFVDAFSYYMQMRIAW